MAASSRRTFLGGFPFFWRSSRFRLAGVEFETIRRRRSKYRYLFLHGNEETAREALVSHMKRASGTAFLVTGHRRHVTLYGLRLDPNRMWSHEGAERNLQQLNPGAQADSALSLLNRDRERLIARVKPPQGGILIAVHSNGPGYSVQEEIPISDEVALNDRANPHEFFLVVQADDYRILSRSPYNAVLQNKAPIEDDGSLSRLAARRKMRYVNIEAALGRTSKQQAMLDWLIRHLPESHE